MGTHRRGRIMRWEERRDEVREEKGEVREESGERREGHMTTWNMYGSTNENGAPTMSTISTETTLKAET